MEDAFSCKYCFNLFKNPVILPGCNHSLCFSCVEKMFLFKIAEKSSPQTHSLKLKQILSTSPTTTATTTSSPQPSEQDDAVINCPNCNVETKLNATDGLTVLKRNDDLRSAVESLTEGRSCVNECGRKATTGCSGCMNASFCDECFSTVHSIPFMRSHLKTSLEQMNKKRTCSVHQKKVTGFCTQCNVVICNTCTSYEDSHKNHNKCITLAQYQAQSEMKFKELQKELQEDKQRIDKFLNEESVTELEKLEVQHQEAVTALNNSAAKKIAEIQKQLAKNLATAVALKQVKERDLRDQHRALKTLSEEIAAVTTIPMHDPIEFGIATQKASKLSSYIKRQYKELKLCCNAIIRYKESTESIALGKVVTLTVPDAPTITSAKGETKAIEVEWSIPNDEDESVVTGYRVEVTNNQDNSPKVIDCTENKLMVENLKGGQYLVRVRAANKVGEGPWSQRSEVEVLDGISLTYESDFDDNGLVYYLGTNGKTTPFSNPAENSSMDAQMSSISFGDPASAAVERVKPITGSMSSDSPNSWFQLELKDCKVIPNYYSLKHSNNAYNVLRNWELQGSNDGQEWTVLRKHENDVSIAEKEFATASWPLSNITEAYRFLRVLQTGVASSGNQYLKLAGFEVYGTMIVE